MVDPCPGSFPSEKDSLCAVYARTGCRMANRGYGFGLIGVVEVVVSLHLEAEEEPRELV